METTNIKKRFEFYQDLDNYEDLEIRIETVIDKWTPFKELSSTEFIYKNDIIHRSIMPSEIIIDLDKPNIEDNKQLLLTYCQLLEDNKIKYYVYYSGGKGFHIHFYFNDYFKFFSDLQKKQVLSLEINERFTLIKKGILEFLKIDLNNIDLQIIEIPRKLIRAEGSKHHKGYFKSFLGSDVRTLNKNLKSFQSSKGFILDDVKIKDKLNEMSKPLHDYLIKKLNIKMEEQKDKRRQEQFNKLRVVKQKGLRPIVKDLLNKPLEDGRKVILFILTRELIGSKINKEDVKNIITKWNNLNHTQGSLTDNFIYLQLKDAISKDVKPLKTETINQYLNQVVFK